MKKTGGVVEAAGILVFSHQAQQFRVDKSLLRSVEHGDHQPTGQFHCCPPIARLWSVGCSLEVADGRTDERFPWMTGSAAVSYCGVPVRDDAGRVIGTVCHFDIKPCQASRSELPLLEAAAALFAPLVDAHRSSSGLALESTGLQQSPG